MLEEIRLVTWDAFFLEDLSKHIIIYHNMFDIHIIFDIQWLFGFPKTKTSTDSTVSSSGQTRCWFKLVLVEYSTLFVSWPDTSGG